MRGGGGNGYMGLRMKGDGKMCSDRRVKGGRKEGRRGRRGRRVELTREREKGVES